MLVLKNLLMVQLERELEQELEHEQLVKGMVKKVLMQNWKRKTKCG